MLKIGTNRKCCKCSGHMWSDKQLTFRVKASQQIGSVVSCREQERGKTIGDQTRQLAKAGSAS